MLSNNNDHKAVNGSYQFTIVNGQLPFNTLFNTVKLLSKVEDFTVSLFMTVLAVVFLFLFLFLFLVHDKSLLRNGWMEKFSNHW